MATTQAFTSDKGIGYSVVFGLLALAGVVLMAGFSDSLVGAAGFSIAVLAGLGAVVAIHGYWQ